jgi:glutaredoxin 3
MTITVYSTTTCAFCHVLTSWLEKENIPYVKKNTDEDETAFMEFMSVNEGNIGVPYTVIKDDSGSETKILGFDQVKFKQVLGI